MNKHKNEIKRNLAKALGEENYLFRFRIDEGLEGQGWYIVANGREEYLVCDNEEVADRMAKDEVLRSLERDGFAYFPQEIEDWAIENAVVGKDERGRYDFDENMIAEEVIRRYGRVEYLAHPISSKEIKIGNGMLAYRINWGL